jgi:hypothetical protein
VKEYNSCRKAEGNLTSLGYRHSVDLSKEGCVLDQATLFGAEFHFSFLFFTESQKGEFHFFFFFMRER